MNYNPHELQQIPGHSEVAQPTFLGMKPTKRFGACFNCSLKTGTYVIAICQILSGIGNLLFFIGMAAHGFHGHHGHHHRGEYDDDMERDYDEEEDDFGRRLLHGHGHHGRHGEHHGQYNSTSTDEYRWEHGKRYSNSTESTYPQEEQREGHHFHMGHGLKALIVVGVILRILAAVFAIYGLKAARKLQAKPAFTYFKFNKFCLIIGTILTPIGSFMFCHKNPDMDDCEEGGLGAAIFSTLFFFLIQGYVCYILFSMATRLQNGEEALVKFGPKFDEMLPYLQGHNQTSHVQHAAMPTYPSQSIQMHSVPSNNQPIVAGIYLQNQHQQQQHAIQNPQNSYNTIPQVQSSTHNPVINQQYNVEYDTVNRNTINQENAVNIGQQSVSQVNNGQINTSNGGQPASSGQGGYVAPRLPGYGNNGGSGNGGYPAF
mmetsp:Transcript_59990/g.68231  ORF Transcript_59990/g.68231 Transcript_59990/m.68231 type:complete len:429 (-) Transcript_59990:712-1998(-)